MRPSNIKQHTTDDTTRALRTEYTLNKRYEIAFLITSVDLIRANVKKFKDRLYKINTYSGENSFKSDIPDISVFVSWLNPKKQAFLGNTTRRYIHAKTCPVLILEDQYTFITFI